MSLLLTWADATPFQKGTFLPVDGGQSGDKSSLPKTVREVPPQVEVPLNGTYWVLEELDGENVSETFGSPMPYLTFNSKEQFCGGSDGCNRIGGECEIRNDQLRWGAIWVTDKLCLDRKEARRKRFTQAWLSTNRYKITGDRLELYKDDKLQVRLKAGQPPPQTTLR